MGIPLQNLIKIGIARKPHGIKGGFTFLSSLDKLEESVLSKGHKVQIKTANSGDLLSMTISEVKIGQKIIVKFSEVNSINELEKLLPFEIFLPREDFKEIESDDEFYIVDLMGLKVLSVTDQSPVGTIVNSYSNGAQEVIVIELEAPSKDQTIELPFVNEFFSEVDLQRGVILVNVPTYLED